MYHLLFGIVPWYVDYSRAKASEQINVLLYEREKTLKIPNPDLFELDEQLIMARHHEDLEKSFTDEQKEIFEKFHDCWSEYMSLAEKAIFVYAFKLGGRLMLETLSEQRKN